VANEERYLVPEWICIFTVLSWKEIPSFRGAMRLYEEKFLNIKKPKTSKQKREEKKT